MSLSAKILTFFNIVLAGAFVYFATQDWLARQPWAYEAFRRELILDGLPLDPADSGPRRVAQALAADLGDDAMGEYYKGAGVADLLKLPGGPETHYVHTQHEAVGVVKDELFKEIDALPDDAARLDRIGALLLLQAETLEERDALAKKLADPAMTVAKAKELLDERFKAALQDRDGDDQVSSEVRRERIAHLLFNLTDDPQKHKRVATVVGLEQYGKTAAAQAENWHLMTHRLAKAKINDRAMFEEEYGKKALLVLQLAHQVASKQRVLADQKVQIARSQGLVDEREKEAMKLKDELDKAKKETEEALVDQEALEKKLFAALRELGRLKEESEKTEQEIRGLEIRR